MVGWWPKYDTRAGPFQRSNCIEKMKCVKFFFKKNCFIKNAVRNLIHVLTNQQNKVKLHGTSVRLMVAGEDLCTPLCRFSSVVLYI